VPYTHRWTRSKEFPPHKLRAVVADCVKVTDHVGIPIQFDHDIPEPAHFDTEQGVHFNGVGEDGFGAFCVSRFASDDDDRTSCISERIPYDLAFCT
jgi:hypothetical protein